jgi:replicative DNA helicase
LIREFPTGSLSVKQLEAFLDMLEHRERFIPDLLVIDYADLMTLPNLDGDLRVKHGELHKQIRGIAGSRNIAVVSAVQANREGLKVSTVTEANIAEDYSKVGTVDTLITGSQTQSEKDLGLMRLFVAKGRDDVSKFQILLSQMYPIGQFVVESTMLNNAYWQVLRGDDEDD